MASNIKFPENQAMYFIEGDKLALLTTVDSNGNLRTASRKKLKAISEAVTDGILIHYYAEPNSVSSITDSIDIDNTLHNAVVDYVKKCLYMDKAGASGSSEGVQSFMSMANSHQRNFKEAVHRYGVRKKDKTGGSRVVRVPNLV
tara:strand:+ start:610 stop:1041 length:432 start_codon:yes stop_codon:yes gene_type:complete